MTAYADAASDQYTPPLGSNHPAFPNKSCKLTKTTLGKEHSHVNCSNIARRNVKSIGVPPQRSAYILSTKGKRPLPSKIFDRPLRNLSGNNSDERSMQAIQLVKEKRPDLWAKFTEHEKNEEGYTDIGTEINWLFKQYMGVSSVLEQIDLSFEVRKQVRREAGLPY